jgi:hypothetical protein
MSTTRRCLLLCLSVSVCLCPSLFLLFSSLSESNPSEGIRIKDWRAAALCDLPGHLSFFLSILSSLIDRSTRRVWSCSLVGTCVCVIVVPITRSWTLVHSVGEQLFNESVSSHSANLQERTPLAVATALCNCNLTLTLTLVPLIDQSPIEAILSPTHQRQGRGEDSLIRGERVWEGWGEST